EFFDERVQMLGRAVPELYDGIRFLNALWRRSDDKTVKHEQLIDRDTGRRAVLVGGNRLAQGADLLVQEAVRVHWPQLPPLLRVLELGNSSFGMLQMLKGALRQVAVQLDVRHCASSDVLREMRQQIAEVEFPDVQYRSGDVA